MTGARRTALRRYARLEAPGLWRPGSVERPREVGVSLGEATLILLDREGRALAHWALPALERLGSPGGPARYGPGEGASESVEIDDPEMVAAIERVRHAVERRAPRRRGRWRGLLLGAGLLLAGGLLLWALPDLARGYAARALPAEARVGLGEALLVRLGEPCEGAEGVAALDALAERLGPGLGGPPVRIVVLAEGLAGAVALPGGLLALPVADALAAAGPGVVVGHLLAAAEEAGPGRGPGGPLEALLEEAGPRETLRLLTAAEISEAALDAHAARLLARPAPERPDAALVPGLLARLKAVDVSAAPFGRATRIPALVDLDPHPEAAPALSDAQWVALQGVCQG